MGQKVHPKGFRIGVIRDWDSKWYAEKNYADLLLEDFKIRRYIKEKLFTAGVGQVVIERTGNIVRVFIHTAKPGMVIGRGGAGVEEIRKALEVLTKKQVYVNIMEIKTPELNAQLVAENVAAQIEKRIAFRRAMRQSMGRTMRSGAKGIRIAVGGRLNGAEIARREWAREGTIPLHTLRADIDYGVATAHTAYGQIGVKVWIYKGEVLPKPTKAAAEGGE
ncbi:MAG: small subunit ribosomal protein S3 [Bacillota bacterium]|nr:MAG: small subunit ribosomal protein S3 [Bacillota bacterium]MBS3950465.1 30S ribosomal protein S3 [Peptococcaceae bacterium]